MGNIGRLGAWGPHCSSFGNYVVVCFHQTVHHGLEYFVAKAIKMHMLTTIIIFIAFLALNLRKECYENQGYSITVLHLSSYFNSMMKAESGLYKCQRVNLYIKQR